jgi:hypothetical protein
MKLKAVVDATTSTFDACDEGACVYVALKWGALHRCYCLSPVAVRWHKRTLRAPPYRQLKD